MNLSAQPSIARKTGKGRSFRSAPVSLAAAAAAVVLAAVPAAVAVAAAVAEDQQEDDDPPPVVAAEAPADTIVVRTHNRYLRSFCWASLPTLHVMTAPLFCAAGGLDRINKKPTIPGGAVFSFVN